ncbi:Flp/Fap pilin component [Candidatus Desulfosporosinus infrequens]|uniref:Flp/Fap pilin component n=1 Tax=Candidatus Desulfosporosinus infrequens TaxID=2043169 RepID=A0A2U3KN81_9FIRM|nr:Flp/Fap pilin component [Candidatus Desulfosporosinus infrequens]
MLTMQMLNGMLRNEKGQGMVEYGLILALIAVVVIGVMTTMGTDLKTMFTTVSTSL